LEENFLISQTAEYALRAVVHLAEHPMAPQTARQVAEATHVPLPYLSKVLQGLSRAGLVNSQRGLHGGFMLLRPSDEVSVYEVIQAVDPLPRIYRCPLGIAEHGEALCPLHRRLDEAMGTIEETFRNTTMAALIEEPTESPMLHAAASGASEVGARPAGR
jgi:Rrf2 family transcriptional regulator, nitric oxide-sensitive transcriptional repressor